MAALRLLLFYIFICSATGEKAQQSPISFLDTCYPRDPFLCYEMKAGWLYNPFMKKCDYVPRACSVLVWEYKFKCEFCLNGVDPNGPFDETGSDHHPARIPNVCSMVTDAGEHCGLAAAKRWRYDPSQEKCVEFDYAGCAGNANNFPSRQACHSFCSYPRRLT